MTLQVDLWAILSYLLAVGGAGVLISGIIGYYLLKHYLPSYFNEKAKNLATKEDIGKREGQVYTFDITN